MRPTTHNVWPLSATCWRAARALVVATILGTVAAAAAQNPNYLHDFPATNDDGTVNAVIEIPAGTTAKFEVTADGSTLEQDTVDGAPRFIHYLAYPWNYGMVPRTLEDPAMGGDGDPLDVIVLGDGMSAGTVAPVRLIGVARMLDSGERDDKLIAVMPGSPLAAASDMDELDAKFPGVSEILRTWLANYKGAGLVEIEGLEDAAEARRVLEEAAAAYTRARGRTSEDT